MHVIAPKKKIFFEDGKLKIDMWETKEKNLVAG